MLEQEAGKYLSNCCVLFSGKTKISNLNINCENLFVINGRITLFHRLDIFHWSLCPRRQGTGRRPEVSDLLQGGPQEDQDQVGTQSSL